MASGKETQDNILGFLSAQMTYKNTTTLIPMNKLFII
jgi:hypothetical protein